LTRTGLLRRTVQGRQVYFQANRESPIFPELHALLLKTAGLVDVLREALAPIADRIAVAFVFGSAARGELGIDSDIDLLVIGEAPFIDVANALVAAQERLGRDVNPTVYPSAEFHSKVHRRHHFLKTVLSTPLLFIIGGPSELERLGTKRLAHGSLDELKRNSRSSRRRRARSGRQRR
jgi:predicted nucleotidyltransferase